MSDERFVSSNEATSDDSRMSRENRPVKKPKYIPMKVENCSKLKVRAEPDTDDATEVLTVLDRGTVVHTDPSFKDADFYMIRFSGNTGYVRKNYLVKL